MTPGSVRGSGLDVDQYPSQDVDMVEIKRITANLPEDLLQEAMAVTGKGITETLVEGLKLVRQAHAFARAMSLRGCIELDIDLEESRDRAGRRHLGVD